MGFLSMDNDMSSRICHGLSTRLGLLLWLVLIWFAPMTSLAQEPGIDDDPDNFTPRMRDGGQPGEREQFRRTEEVPQRVVNQRMRDYIESGNSRITVYRIVEEMIDDFIADSKDLNIAAISPVAIRSVGLSPNLSRAFGDWAQAEMTTAINRHTDIRIKRCVACNSLKTRLEGDDWVVQLGLVEQRELREEGQRLGVVAFLDAFISYVPGANIVSMNVQIYRADDGKVIWSETYRSDATTAAILRTGDRILTRDEARAELVRKIEQRPTYGYTAWLGAGFLQYSGAAGNISALAPGIRLYEMFGEDQRYLFGIFAEGFLNFSSNPITGAFIGGSLQYQINEPNLNDVIMRAGGSVAGFLAGTEGNSFALEGTFDIIMQFRLGAGVSLMYFVPTEFAGADLGGFGAKARLTFNF
jgi:TolB-like protein